MAAPAFDRDTILRAIEAWPVDEQITLARAILDRAGHGAAHADRPQPLGGSSWEALYGIASTGRKPLTDEGVAQWLDERRSEKYGG